MKKLRKFPVSGLVTAALIAAVIFGGAVPVLAQTDSTTSGARTRYQQGTNPSTPPRVTFTTLVNFDGTNGTNGAVLTQGTDGNLYGSSGGGANGSGLLFKMTPAGKLTPVYNFCSETGCADGNGPGDPVLGTDGNLHGGTLYGGAFGSAQYSRSRRRVV